ncbi:hypothetical protein AWL63_14490 [Sphingomonas panacis]|uniref:TonB-dependent receptor n=2 Tax=Sphingomonas panacis TaxID=1560345 RepID=A0A1B3ZC26_9SPHN|nr:hypothetical protein AWL63_14490 [Sphingomonas panacis]
MAQTAGGTAAPVPNADGQAPADAAQAPHGPDGSVMQTAAPDDANVADIVVTASRIGRAGFNAPTPTVVVGAATLEQRAAVNVADVLNEVPSFRRTAAPESGGIGNVGANNVDLRGLTPVRTLVLLDRLRLPGVTVPGQTVAGVPDLNIIPTALIKQVDVVTGGASAAYGSDAVAGVVNLQLNTKLQGIKANAQYGATRYNDAREFYDSIAAGTGFADGRGHIVVGGEYQHNDGTDLFNDKRAWGRQNAALVSLPANRAAGLPANLVANNVTFGTLTTGGLITPTVATNPVALRNLQFVVGPNGATTTAPFDAGAYQGQIATQMIGGSNVSPYQVLRGPSERYNLLGHVTYDFSDHVSVWAQGLYSNVYTHNVSAQIRAATGGTGPFITIRRDNAYLQQALTPGQLALVPAGGLSIGYLGNDFGPPALDTTNETTRFAGGLKGAFGSGWRWDVSGNYGRNKSVQLTSNSAITGNFNNAVDAVRVTSANVGASGLPIGSIACRSTLATPTNGCVPINILGQASYSPAAYAYAFGTSRAQTISTLLEGSANISGEPVSLWAGPVTVGAGVEIRRETLETNVDATSQAGLFAARVARNSPHVGQTVKEVYGEVIIPLLKDASFTKSLEFNGAARYTNYTTSGSVGTWKVGLTWKPIQDILFRSTLSRDIRAPSLPELFTPSVASVPSPLTNGAATDVRPAFVNQAAYAYSAITGGSAKLTPEIGHTFTAGVVFQPRFLSRFQASVDFYRIRVSNAIGATSPATIIQNCVGTGTASAGNPYCQLISFANNDLANGAILSVNGANANFAEFRTKGLDIAASYMQPLDEISAKLPGRLALTAQATHVIEYRSSLDVSLLYPNGVNRAGQTGALFGGSAGLPSWQVNGNIDYKVGRLDVNAQIRHISKSHQNNALIGPDQTGYSPALFNSISNNVIPAVTYFNFGASLNIGSEKVRSEVYFVLNNAFDKAPPLPAINNNAYYDLLGRAYRIGVRFGF